MIKYLSLAQFPLGTLLEVFLAEHYTQKKKFLMKLKFLLIIWSQVCRLWIY